jgi:hypothetical protein
MIIREQADASRQALRVHLAEASDVVPFAGPADLAAGREVIADVDLTLSAYLRCASRATSTSP